MERQLYFRRFAGSGRAKRADRGSVSASDADFSKEIPPSSSPSLVTQRLSPTQLPLFEVFQWRSTTYSNRFVTAIQPVIFNTPSYGK